MKCVDYIKLIDKKLDGEITCEEEELLAGHLNECAKCAEYARFFSSIMPSAPLPSEDFEQKVMSRIEREAVLSISEIGKRRKIGIFAFAMAAAAIIIAFIIIYEIATIKKPQEPKRTLPIITTTHLEMSNPIELAGDISKNVLKETGKSLKESASLIDPKSADLDRITESFASNDNMDTLKHDYELTKTKIRSFYEGIVTDINFM